MGSDPLRRDEAERERLEALRATEILDTPPEADFDALTRIAAAVCATPIAVVSLVDAHREWFKSKVGLAASEVPRDAALGVHAMGEPDLLVVPDTRADERFADNPLVRRDPSLRFYAAAPLRTADGHAIGTLCVIDYVPRQLTREQRSALRDLGEQATAQIELRRSVAELRRAMADRERAEAALRAALESHSVPSREPPPASPTRPGVAALAALVVALALTLWGAHLSRNHLERQREHRLPEFEAGERPWEPLAILGGGGAASLLLFGFVWSLASTRRVAVDQAASISRAFRASEERVRAIMDTVADGILAFDDDGTVRSANRGAERLFGARLSELIGQRLAELVPGADVLVHGADAGVAQRHEAEARRADGTVVPVDLAVSRMEEGSTLVAILRDVSDRRATERQLRESEQRTRSIIQNMLGGLVTIDEGGTIESANVAAGRIFGYEPAEMVGRPLAMLVPTSVGDKRAYLKEAFARAIGRITEWRGQRKGGDEFPFELSMFEFTASTPGRHFAGSVRDVSERHAVEKLKQEFVSTVSHELRTPLASIRGSMSLLAGGVLGDLSDEAREMVAIAERNCARLIALVNDILDLERLEHGRLQMEFTEVSLAEVLGRTRESVLEFANERQVALEMDPTAMAVRADADRLVQVLVNLVSNAVKFSPAGAAVHVAVRESGGRARVEVIDRGRGVPAAHRSAIFERFRQVESSDARDKGGTGLGLAICKAIVEQHGGDIGVESEEGRGSTFWFEVPSAPAADRFLESFRGGDGRPDVILADHDVTLLGVLVRQLVGAGVQVRVAKDAEEAERAVREAAPRLLVVDLDLPDGEGRRLLDHLRAEERLSLLPLLVYTAQDIDEAAQGGLSLGPTRFLTKSRASDAEVTAMVCGMLEVEAREAHP